MNIDINDGIDEDLLEEVGDFLFLDGTPYTGTAFYYFPNGKVQFETTYFEGLCHGFIKEYSDASQLIYYSECRCGMRHGVVRVWFPGGCIKSSGDYEFGIPLSEREWDELGVMTRSFELTEENSNFEWLQKMRMDKNNQWDKRPGMWRV